jgi:predicted metal-dependent phosphoesterase TrpH
LLSASAGKMKKSESRQRNDTLDRLDSSTKWMLFRLWVLYAIGSIHQCASRVCCARTGVSRLSSLQMSSPNITLNAQDAIDLHMHTTYSDGHWAPKELFDHLAGHHFRLVAVTDHDRVDRIGEMQALGAERAISVLAGVEVTTDWEGRMAHLLCYGFDPAGGALATLTRQTFDGQLANTHAVYDELLRRGYAFPRQAEILQANGGTLTRPVDNAVLLREHGYVPDMRAGITLMTDAGYRSIAAPLAAAIAAAHADGGVALIAHPGRRETGFTLYTPAVLDEVRAAGLPLDGIEVYYPLYTPEQTREYEAYVKQHGWLASAGSDSHGPRQRFPIVYAAYIVAPLLARCGVSLVF